MIVVEGVDGSGKTTLAKYIAGLNDRNVYQHFGPLAHPYLTYLWQVACPPTNQLVLDRFYPSEHVYGPILRNCDLVGVHDRTLARLLLSHESVMIFCDPGFEISRANWASSRSAQLAQNDSVFEELYWRYQGVMVPEHINVIGYDYTDDHMDDILEIALGQMAPVNKGPGVGHFIPEVTLLVGEKPSKGCGPELPFCWHKGCSGWLNEKLNEAGIDERDLYWINAFDRTGEETDPSFVDILEPRQIIAMGQVAKNWCRWHGLTCRHVPHPQAWKRFYHHDPYPLTDYITDN